MTTSGLFMSTYLEIKMEYISGKKTSNKNWLSKLLYVSIVPPVALLAVLLSRLSSRLVNA